MAIHHFRPTHYHTAIGSHEPVLRVGNGDTVITTTVDAMGKDASEVQVTPEGNPQTGPFYVADAEPGDTLVVSLDRIVPSRSIGYTGSVVAVNVVDPSYVGELPERELAEWRVDNGPGTATLIKPETKLGNLTIPLAPMLGCFGVAPPGGQASRQPPRLTMAGTWTIADSWRASPPTSPSSCRGLFCMLATATRPKEMARLSAPV